MKQRGFSLLLAVALVAGETCAQKAAPNDPSECPYCGGDPKLLAAAGLVSHGGFEFARTDTAGADALLPNLVVLWIESKHFEVGFALGPHKVTQKEKNKIREELSRLQRALPAVNPRDKILDPWLRAHLYAQRFEDTYSGFLDVMQVTEELFPDGTKLWMPGTPYWGEGPYLGQRGKYEVLVVPSASNQVSFMRDQFGLSIKHTQKWNVVDRDSLLFVANLTEDGIRGDDALHNHLVFNTIHNLVDGFLHYSYDTPLYLKEGLAHWFERRITPEYNTFSFSEGGIADKINKADWDTEVKKMIQRQEAPRLAELITLDGFGEFEGRHHLACWSLTAFFLERYPAEYAQLNTKLHGRKDASGLPDGSNLRDAHRDLLRQIFGKSYAEIDAEWSEWALQR